LPGAVPLRRKNPRSPCNFPKKYGTLSPLDELFIKYTKTIKERDMNKNQLRTLFIRHWKDFTCFAHWLTRDPDEANDLVQESYYGAGYLLENIPEDECDFIGWVLENISSLHLNCKYPDRHERKPYQYIFKHPEIAQHETDHNENAPPLRLMVFDGIRRIPRVQRPPNFPTQPHSAAIRAELR
jgi:DNA-directed RNA polymerase specialized sigma24 family protein